MNANPSDNVLLTELRRHCDDRGALAAAMKCFTFDHNMLETSDEDILAIAAFVICTFGFALLSLLYGVENVRFIACLDGLWP